jgi:hypothetical protein
MRINSKLLGLSVAVSALVWLVQITACTGGDDSASGGAGGTGTVASAGTGTMGAGTTGSGTAGAGTAGAGTTGSAGASASSAGSSGSSAGAGSGTTATVCANPTVIPSTKPGIADFEGYDGATSFATWSFSLGGDSSLGVLAGTFSYGDRTTGFPETSELSAGHASMYAMRIADTDASRTPGTTGLYGGGMGLWQSACINATAFTGISFWARGSSPSPTVTLTISMQETTTATPAKSTDKPGTCSGTATACVHPTFAFPLAADATTWTQIKAPWASFKAGSAAGTAVTPDGRNITQLQFGIGLNFVAPDGSTVYEAVPAAYELAVDDLTFY